MADRYAEATRGEDLGLGSDEPDVRRFTRVCERLALAFERGRRSARDQLDLLAHDDVAGRATAAQRLIDALPDTDGGLDYEQQFNAGYRGVLLDAIAEGAADQFEQYRGEHPDDRSSTAYTHWRDAMFATKDRADTFAHETTKPAAHPTKDSAAGSHINHHHEV